jgi:hypothetical protein
VSVLITCPFAVRPWALPLLVAWSRDPAGDQAHGTRHQTPAPLARLRLARVVCWFPARQCIVVGDTGYGTSATARCCRTHGRPLTLVSTLYGDAALYDPPPPRTRRPMGRPGVQGPTRASPQAVVATTVHRTRLTLAWYGGSTRNMEVVTGPGHWYHIGEALVDIRWVDVHDGTGTHRDESCLTTAISMSPQQIVECDTPRWSIATTLQACREYLKLEATRGYGQATVRRLTPCLWG